MKCSVCKKPVKPQYNETFWGMYSTVAAAHPAKKGKGLCDGSGKPERKGR